MAWNCAVNDLVYVPVRFLPNSEGYSHAIYQTTVAAVQGRSVRVNVPDGESDFIATSKIHKNLGVALISIGDFQTETALLDPLAKGLLQFCRLLLPDDYVRAVRVRAIGELGRWWELNHHGYSHIVLIGHGDATGITFAIGGERQPASFKRRLAPHNAAKKTFISLCCKTGRRPFASEFSDLPFCGHFIAPFNSIHGAIASQFCQSFLNLHLIQARSVRIAFRLASASMPSGETFRLWREGFLS